MWGLSHCDKNTFTLTPLINYYLSMIVRIDTTNLTRGREFTLYAKNPDGLPVTMRGLDILTGGIVELEVTHQETGEFDGYLAVAPQLDGYLLAKVAGQVVVKKIGHPLPAFTLGYRENYTVAYTAYGVDGIELESGNLTPVGDGFYFTRIPNDTVVVKALNKNFIVNKNLLKMNYEVTMDGGELNSIYDTPVLENVALPDVVLPETELGEATLDSTLPEITITEL